MAIAAGVEGQQQESRLPTPALAPAEPAGLQYEPLDASDDADQEDLSRLDAAGSGQSVCSEDSWTTDDEASATVNGNQMWSMSFEWQDGHAEDTSEAIAQFEETTDFSGHSVDPTSEQSSSAVSSSARFNGDAAEPSPADVEWVQPWNQTDTAMMASSCHSHNDSASARPSSTKQKSKPQPMSEEHKTAILGAMKNVKIDYVPKWAMYMEETRWLNSIKAKAAKEPQSK
ncbi:hypothetical protein WJX77_011039 [Trebouxia sp. C0004]